MKTFIDINNFQNKLFNITPLFCTMFSNYTTRLLEVGRLEAPVMTGNYKTGQVFLHKLFGYRGVILFPWLARIFDRDKAKRKLQELESENGTKKVDPESSQTFYNVLIDSRDSPFIKAQSESVSFLGSQDSGRGLVTIPGLDYVAHTDILPYKPTERHPFHHELLNKFLKHNADSDPPFVAKNTLLVWQKKNYSWLELTKVHKETTELVRVTVIPFYMGSRMSTYWWRYSVCLENLSDLAVQLRERHWRIFSLSGSLESVRGRGVVGQQPVLTRREPVFQYSSHISLHEPSGHMWGTLRMEREDGYTFDCRVPSFSLESRDKEISTPSSYPE